MCAQTLIPDYVLSINRIDDSYFFSKIDDKPSLKIFKFGFETDYYYYIYYKCNRNFVLQFSNTQNFSHMYTVETSTYQNTIEVPKNVNDEILVIRISTNKTFKGFVQMDQKIISLNETNNYSQNIYISLDIDKRVEQSIVFLDGFYISDLVEHLNIMHSSKTEVAANATQTMLAYLTPYNGIQFYDAWHEQKLSLFTSNLRFKHDHYFKFFDAQHGAIAIENRSDCSTGTFPSGNVWDMSELKVSKISFYESTGIVITEKSPPLNDDGFSEIISKCQQTTSVKIKNLIVDDQELTTKIEDYWICSSLGQKVNKAYINFQNFDIVDQPSSIEYINDSVNSLNNILAANINLSVNGNYKDILVENVFYLSYNTRLTLELKLVQCILKKGRDDNSIFSVDGTLLDTPNLDGSCCVYMTSFNLSKGPFMKYIHGSRIKNSEFSTGNLIVKYINVNSINVNQQDFKLPFNVTELYFFVKLYFKSQNELYCIFCFQVPITFH